MKKVLHLFPAYKIGGGPINVLRFIKNSKSLYVNYCAGKKEDTDLYEDFERHAKAIYNTNLCKVSFKSTQKLLKITQKIKPDIIHAHGKGGALYGFVIKIIHPKPIRVYYTFRGFHLKYSGLTLKLYLLFEYLFSKMIQKGIAVSTSEREFYLKQTKAAKNKVVVIANGISIHKKDLPFNIQSTVSQYTINLVSLARISYQKDLETMLKTFNQLNHKVALHILGGYLNGDKPYKKRIDNLYETLNNNSNIYFWGDVPNAGDLIHNFDIYWTTSLFEGLPTAVVEAMLSKTLVVGTNCRGNIDLIKPKQTGLLTKMKDIDDNLVKLQEGIQILNTEKGNLLIENAYRMAQRFSIANHVKNISQLYDS